MFDRELRKKEAEWEKRGISGGGRSPLKNSPSSAWEKKKSFIKPDTSLNIINSGS